MLKKARLPLTLKLARTPVKRMSILIKNELHLIVRKKKNKSQWSLGNLFSRKNSSRVSKN